LVFGVFPSEIIPSGLWAGGRQPLDGWFGFSDNSYLSVIITITIKTRDGLTFFPGWGILFGGDGFPGKISRTPGPSEVLQCPHLGVLTL
jgi:hypothetical protein